MLPFFIGIGCRVGRLFALPGCARRARRLECRLCPTARQPQALTIGKSRCRPLQPNAQPPALAARRFDDHRRHRRRCRNVLPAHRHVRHLVRLVGGGVPAHLVLHAAVGDDDPRGQPQLPGGLELLDHHPRPARPGLECGQRAEHRLRPLYPHLCLYLRRRLDHRLHPVQRPRRDPAGKARRAAVRPGGGAGGVVEHPRGGPHHHADARRHDHYLRPLHQRPARAHPAGDPVQQRRAGRGLLALPAGDPAVLPDFLRLPRQRAEPDEVLRQGPAADQPFVVDRHPDRPGHLPAVAGQHPGHHPARAVQGHHRRRQQRRHPGGIPAPDHRVGFAERVAHHLLQPGGGQAPSSA